jgi:hypothetical protein
VIERVLAALLACACVAGGAGVGFAEPRPAPQLRPAERLSEGAESPGLMEHATPVGPLVGVEGLPSAPRAVSGASPVTSVGSDVPASFPLRAASPDHADALEPAGEVSEPRIKP